MSASFYDLLKYAATGIASPDMTYYDRMRASTLMGGATVQTLTGQPPLTFKADGSPLISWSMKGNGSQSGTPTPDNPVMPEFVGVKTGNLANLILGKVPRAADGTLVTFNGLTCEYVPITSMSDTFSLTFEKTGSTKKFYVYFYSGDTLLTTKDLNYGTTITTYGVSSTVDRMRIRIDYGDYTVSDVMLVKGSTPATTYEPFGYKIPISCGGQTTPVYLGQTQTVRRIKKLVLTGEETFVATTASTHYRCRTTLVPKAITQISTSVLSTHYFSSAGARDGAITLTTDGGSVYFTDDTNAVTAEAFKSYLAQQYAAGTPVVIWYVLATEQTAIINEPLAKIGDYCDELSSTDAGVTIPTAKGANTLTVDTELPPSEMTITFKG